MLNRWYSMSIGVRTSPCAGTFSRSSNGIQSIGGPASCVRLVVAGPFNLKQCEHDCDKMHVRSQTGLINLRHSTVYCPMAIGTSLRFAVVAKYISATDSPFFNSWPAIWHSVSASTHRTLGSYSNFVSSIIMGQGDRQLITGMATNSSSAYNFAASSNMPVR